jgi:competence protein ComEA
MKKYYLFFVSIIVMTVLSTLLLASDRIESSFSRNSGTGSQSWGVVNVNTATADQITALGSLNRISSKLAQGIVDYRNEKGPFKSLDDLINVKGMNRTRLDDLKPWLVLEGKSTFRSQR